MKALLLVCCCSLILLFSMACTSEPSPTLNATTPPSPSPSPSPFPSPSSSPTQTTHPTLTTIPAVNNIEREARALRKAAPGTSCEGLYYQCLAPYAIRALDFLYQHPTTPYREELVERLVNTLGYKHVPFSIEWLVEEWMDEVVRQPFDAAGGLPAGFADEWQRGEIGKPLRTIC